MMMDRPGWLICTNENCKSRKGFREDLNRGDIICTQCGRVVSEKTIDQGSEWRNFADSGENKSRAENVDDILDKISTRITAKGEGGKNNPLTRIQQQLSGNEQRPLSQAVEKISEFAELMSLKEDVRKKAKQIYKKFESKKARKIRGSNSDAIYVAVIYLACKELNVSRTFKELSIATGVRDRDIKKMFVLVKDLGGTSRTAPVKPSELVIRLCSHLELPPSLSVIAQKIANNATSRLEGKSPSSIAAASVYMAVKANNLNTTERDIAKAASISASTVKNIYKEMESWKEDLLPLSNGGNGA